jgi:hypothetical protein
VTAARLFVALLVFSSIPGAFAQRMGQTRTVTVPLRSESWSAKAVSGPLPARNRIDVAPPHHVANSQAVGTSTGQSAQGAAATSTSLIGKVFPGPADELPPDSDVAAGPNHVVATVNAVIVIYDKNGKQISQTQISDFFSSLPGGFCCFDLRVLYDQANGRFIIAAARTDYGAPSSHIFVAVSATSDPTGTWNKYAIEESSVFWSDFPTVGLTPNALYITADRIPFAPGPAGWDITVIAMPELLSGNPNLRITDFPNVKAVSGASVFGPIIPAVTYGASAQEYLVSNGPPGVLYIFSISESGSLTLSSAKLTTAPYPPPPLAAQPGSSTGLGVGGDGVFTVVTRNGSLWVTQSIGSGPGTPAANAIIRWYEIDPTGPSLRQLGTVAGAGDAYMPALTVRPDGEVDLVYTTSSTKQFASAGYSHRNPTDPPNTMPVSGIYTPGDSVYPNSRWGDVSGISVDPDGTSTWGIAEYATKGNFATSIVQILSGVPINPIVTLSINPATATIAAGQSATFTVSVTGQALTSPVTLACTQGMPTSATCTFTPTSVSAGQSATLTVSTKPRTSASSRNVLTSLFAALCAFGIVIVPRRWRGLTSLVGMIVVLAVITSCGGVGGSSNGSGGSNGGGGGSSGTPAGTYTVTVSGTSGNTVGSTSLNLVVQ